MEVVVQSPGLPQIPVAPRRGSWTRGGEPGDVNLADPRTLYDFVRWGLERSSSPRHLLILSGHGAGIVGALTDFAHGAACIMGVSGLARALALAQLHAGRAVDVLMMDACYMNAVEVAHELATSGPPAARHLIVPLEMSPLEGWPYGEVLDRLGQGGEEAARNPVAVLLQAIAGACEFPALAVYLTPRRFARIKQAAHELACCLLGLSSAPGTPEAVPVAGGGARVARGEGLGAAGELWSLLRGGWPHHPCAGALQRLRDAVAGVVITGREPEPPDRHRYLTVFLPVSPAEYRKWSSYYETLSFSRDNAWVELLGGPAETAGVRPADGPADTARIYAGIRPAPDVPLPGPLLMPRHLLVQAAEL